MKNKFKQAMPFSKRIELSNRLGRIHLNKIPLILDVAVNNKKNLKLHRTQYLVHETFTLGDLLTEIRKYSTIHSYEVMFLFCGNNASVLVPTNNLISDVYKKYKDADGFLYITVALENEIGPMQTIDYILETVLDNSCKLATTLGLHIF